MNETDKTFSHSSFGYEVRIEQYGREVHLIFAANTRAQSDDLCAELLRQLKGGEVKLTLKGEPSSIEEY